ncbi:hypothetical protein H0W91_00455 [Patescibacteria group bacterium]|nr:hypothetical protein [Patescibacteria group bacterium]
MKKVIYAVMAFSPAFAFAQGNLSGLSQLVTAIGQIIAKIIPIMFALAIIFFFWGVIQFLRGAGDPKAQEQGKSHMIYGVIAIAVMVSVYGLVIWLQNALGISTVTAVPLPTVPGL